MFDHTTLWYFQAGVVGDWRFLAIPERISKIVNEKFWIFPCLVLCHWTKIKVTSNPSSRQAIIDRVLYRRVLCGLLPNHQGLSIRNTWIFLSSRFYCLFIIRGRKGLHPYCMEGVNSSEGRKKLLSTKFFWHCSCYTMSTGSAYDFNLPYSATRLDF